MSIGQDLTDVPFADLVHKLGSAIAESQLELDRTAITTLEQLILNKVPVVPTITDVISSVPRSATLPDGTVVPYSGAEVTSSGAAAVEISLYQAGVSPTFYQFTETNLEVKMSITVKQGSAGTTTGALGRPRPDLRIHASPVDFRTSNTYSYTAQGSSLFRTVLKPVPGPSRAQPTRVTVDNTVQPPRVSVLA